MTWEERAAELAAQITALTGDLQSAKTDGATKAELASLTASLTELTTQLGELKNKAPASEVAELKEQLAALKTELAALKSSRPTDPPAIQSPPNESESEGAGDPPAVKQSRADKLGWM